MVARIYKPGKSATQSGAAKNRSWVLDHEPSQSRDIEPLMGWTSSGDMNAQVRLYFASREEAENYAKRNGIAYRVEETHESARRLASYSDNFRSNRIGQWTH
jgi:ETC complex I subunit conserved region